jgi:hypothetical protein
MTGTSTGDFNSALGNDALLTNSSGSYNTALGDKADVQLGNLSNATAIGYNAKVTASNSIQLGNASVTDVNTSGTITALAFTPTSDRRLKSKIAPLKNSLSTIMQLNPVHYMKKAALELTNYNMEENGFIAQELQKVLPFIVKEGNDENKLLSVNYISIIPLLTKGIQEQQNLIESQQKQIESQQKQLDEIQELIKLLISKKNK